jgi:hypothetical protein
VAIQRPAHKLRLFVLAPLRCAFRQQWLCIERLAFCTHERQHRGNGHVVVIVDSAGTFRQVMIQSRVGIALIVASVTGR